MDDLGIPPFLETSIYVIYIYHFIYTYIIYIYSPACAVETHFFAADVLAFASCSTCSTPSSMNHFSVAKARSCSSEKDAKIGLFS